MLPWKLVLTHIWHRNDLNNHKVYILHRSKSLSKDTNCISNTLYILICIVKIQEHALKHARSLNILKVSSVVWVFSCSLFLNAQIFWSGYELGVGITLLGQDYTTTVHRFISVSIWLLYGDPRGAVTVGWPHRRQPCWRVRAGSL